MISVNDFKFKQIVIANMREGEKVKVDNDCLTIVDSDGKTKVKVSFYRVFVVYLFGNFSITTNLIEKSKKYGFSIIIMTYSFRYVTSINNGLEGNYILHKKQYEYAKIDPAKELIKNKLMSQVYNLQRTRDKMSKDLAATIEGYLIAIDELDDYKTLLAIEGLAAKQYFKAIFKDEWKGRMPRTKIDPINTTLDIGYTLLFNFVESIANIFDFDVYIGILHKEFYKRKSLICDLVEPFRYIVDYRIRKAFNNKEFKAEDFKLINNCYFLNQQLNNKYISVFANELLVYKDEIFKFIAEYYRWFMKDKNIEDFPRINYGADN